MKRILQRPASGAAARLSSLGALLSSLAASACGDPLKSAQKIEDPRVLAVSVSDTEGSATPDAGETAEVLFLLAGPLGPIEGQIAYKICAAADSARGVPFCEGEVFAEGELSAAGAVPSVAFAVPEATAPGTRFAILAAFCTSSTPALGDNPLDWSCADGSEPFSLSFDGWTKGSASEKNANPVLADVAVEVRDQVVTPDDPGASPECGTGVVELEADRTHTFSIHLGEDAREGEEWLQVSHFSTKGLFERQYTVVEPEEETDITLEWDAPATAGPVKQYLVVRDGFGGVSFVSWTVCLL